MGGDGGGGLTANQQQMSRDRAYAARLSIVTKLADPLLQPKARRALEDELAVINARIRALGGSTSGSMDVGGGAQFRYDPKTGRLVQNR